MCVCGSANNTHPLSLGGTNGKYPINGIYSVSPPPPVFFMTPSYKLYVVIYSTLLCKKIARAPGGHKRFMLTKRGGGGETE